MLGISEQRLGKDYLSADLLEKSLNKEANTYFVNVASVDANFNEDRSIALRLGDARLGQTPNINKQNLPSDKPAGDIIGFCVGAVFDQDGLNTYLNTPVDQLSEGLSSANKVGVIRTIAVTEDFENRGVATSLLENCITACLDNGATVLCAVGWEEDSQVNIDGHMSQFDFRLVGKIDEYWKKESIEQEFNCTSCGDPPCTCSAAIYVCYS